MLESLLKAIERGNFLKQLEMLFLDLRGQLGMNLYDLGGQMRYLEGGVADLKRALNLLAETVMNPGNRVPDQVTGVEISSNLFLKGGEIRWIGKNFD